MSVRSRFVSVSFAAIAVSALVAAACSEAPSSSLATAEVAAVTSAAFACADAGYPPPPPSDTSSSFDYSGGSASLDGDARFLLASSAEAGYVKTSEGLQVATQYMLNDGTGNGFIAFDRVPTMISANARLTIRDCQITGGKGTILLPMATGGTIKLDLSKLFYAGGIIPCVRPPTVSDETAPRDEAATDLRCVSLSGGDLVDTKGGVYPGRAPNVTFRVGVGCDDKQQAAGICRQSGLVLNPGT